jgi:hypothetical protein
VEVVEPNNGMIFLRTEAENISQSIEIPPFIEAFEITGEKKYDTYAIANQLKEN